MYKVKAGISKQTLSAVITRADGTKEDLGVIAEFNNKKIGLFGRFFKWLMS